MFKREELEQFVRRGEKSAPPVFVGRERIFDDILTIAGEAWTAENHTLPGVTRILQGAPGAGKSATLAELEKILTTGTNAPNIPTPRILSVTSSMLEESVHSVLSRLYTIGGLDPGVWRERGRTFLKGSREVLDSVSIGGTTFKLSKTDLGGLEALKRVLPPHRWTASVIVAIDEAQNLPAHPNTPTGILLRALHEGQTGLPLTLVLTGLGDTVDHAANMGLTRGLTIHMIEALETDDVTQLMTGFCAHFGMDCQGFERQLDALAAPCEGWPRHLHVTLAALASEVLATHGDLRPIDWNQVRAAAAAGRRRYYQRQQSAEMRRAAALVAAVMRDLQETHRKPDIIDSLREHIRQAGADAPTRMQIPKDMTPLAFADHLIHRGALQETPDYTITCPIPSFRNWLIEEGGIAHDSGP